MEGLESLETYVTIFQKTRNIVLVYLTLKESNSSPFEVLYLLLETRGIGSVIGLFLCNTDFGSLRRFSRHGSCVFVPVYQPQIVHVEATNHLYTLRRQLNEQNTQHDEC